MKTTVRSMVLAALMTALMCLLSPFSIPVGMTVMTMQTFLTALTGYLLRPRAALMAVGAYLMLGACGLPVFSGFSGGFGVLAGPTGGFLLGFPGMAAVCAASSGKGRWVRLGAGLAGLAMVYLVGAAWMASAAGMNYAQALLVGAAPFVWKDVLSVLGAQWLTEALNRRGIGRESGMR